MKHNILWGILHGGTELTAEWIRGTDEKPGFSGRPAFVKDVLYDADDSVRGYYTEAIVQQALLSDKAERIAKLDPVNTYRTPLSGDTQLPVIVSEPVTVTLKRRFGTDDLITACGDFCIRALTDHVI